jgi:hypothetical protein
VIRIREAGIVVTMTAIILASGCVPISANDPGSRNHYQILTAGHTGCQPNENLLTNLSIQPDGDGTWNATCKTKVYLCSVTGQKSEIVSCAVVAQ